ncbi:MAG: hypothetical protein EZS28_039834 [Streblomastix strix]|uniref:Uncharacterized protein n=1 Tax=Streblomastix strix TaxID=222440 RepID=A0A5J4U3D9_9EUKA|nr:MAG: hypothetical protein EZS28_039834 [Streblomastix strix]
MKFRKIEEELKVNIVIPIRKEQIKRFNPTFMIKKSKLKMQKNTGCESVELIDCRLPLQNARFDRGETNNQTWALEYFNGTNQHITLSVKGIQVLKPSWQVQEKRFYQNI